MTRWIAPLCLAAAFATAGAASAATFSATLDVDYNDTDPGLVIQVANIGGGSVDLDEGESVGFTAFDIYTNETFVNRREDTAPKDIEVAFTFDSPAAVGGSITGSTRGRYVRQDGIVTWDGPLVLSFGPGGTGQFTVELFSTVFNDGCFLCGGLKEGYKYRGTVNGELTYDMAPVPVPASALLLLGGLGGLSVLRRRKAAA